MRFTQAETEWSVGRNIKLIVILLIIIRPARQPFRMSHLNPRLDRVRRAPAYGAVFPFWITVGLPKTSAIPPE